MSRSPAAILYDESAHPVGVILDGAIYRLQTEAKLATGHGLATEAKQDTTITELQSRTKPTDLQKAVLYDAAGHAVNVVLDGSDYRLLTQVKLATGHGLATEAKQDTGNTSLSNIDTKVATASNQTDGSQKAVVRGGAKGTTVAADVTSTSISADRQALDVVIQNANPVPIQYYADLSKLLNFTYNKSDGALVAGAFKQVITYIVPVGYSLHILRFTSYQAEVAASRVAVERHMGTLVVSTNVYTSLSSYTSPQWVSVVEAQVTTQIQSGSGNVVITVSYTNESGTAGRTGTITIPRGSAVGTKWLIAFQTGDLGLRSIQSASASPTVTGAVELNGVMQLCIHEDQSTTTQTETQFPPGSLVLPAGTEFNVEYAGGTVSKLRIFDVLAQLVAV